MDARFLVLILVAVTAHLAVAEGRTRCDCLPTTVETSTRIYSDIIKGVVTDSAASPNADGTVKSYLVKISWVYQGCLGMFLIIVIRLLLILAQAKTLELGALYRLTLQPMIVVWL